MKNRSKIIYLIRKTNYESYRSIGNAHKTTIKYFIAINNLHFQCHVVSTAMKLILTYILLGVFLILLNADNTLQSKVIINTNKSWKLYPRSVKLINARKYQKYKGLQSLKPNVRKKLFDTTYTVFPATGLKELHLTERFYIDPFERKSRVKKVLPAYQIPIIRKKRNAPTIATFGSKNLKENVRSNKSIKTKKNNKNIQKKRAVKRNRKSSKKRLRNKNKQSRKVKRTKTKTRNSKGENKKKKKLRKSENKGRSNKSPHLKFLKTRDNRATTQNRKTKAAA